MSFLMEVVFSSMPVSISGSNSIVNTNRRGK